MMTGWMDVPLGGFCIGPSGSKALNDHRVGRGSDRERTSSAPRSETKRTALQSTQPAFVNSVV